MDMFNSVNQQAPDDRNMSDDEDADSAKSLHSIRPPGKERKLRDESYKPDIWNMRVKISDLSPPGK